MIQTFIQMRNERTMFLDTKTNKKYRIEKVFSEHNTNHIRVLYLISEDGRTKAQMTDNFFNFLVETKQFIKQ